MTEIDAARLTYTEVRKAFDNMPTPSPGAQLAYGTEPLRGTGMRLGKSQNANACLLIPGQRWSGDVRRDRHYANLRLRHGLRLKVASGGAAEVFAVLECVSRDPAVSDWFLRLLPTLTERLNAPAGSISFDEQIERIGELFRLLDQEADNSLPGLWAELLLIVGSARPELAVRAWRNAGASLHDFTSNGCHVEVKATELGERRHSFSAGQLQPSDEVLVASVLLESSDQGRSVMDLHEEVLELLPEASDIQEKVNSLVMACVGRRLAAAEETRFDVPTALASISFVRAGYVPQLPLPFPAGVSNVRFTADLSVATVATPSELRERDLWSCMAPWRSGN